MQRKQREIEEGLTEEIVIESKKCNTPANRNKAMHIYFIDDKDGQQIQRLHRTK